MNVAKSLAVVGLVVATLASTSAQTADVRSGTEPPPTVPKMTGAIYLTNGNSVLAYAPGSDGNVAPIAAIGDRSNMLEMPWSIALDSKANIYVANFAGGSGAVGSINVYAAGSDGDTTPIANISGPNTGLNNPFGIAVDSSGKIYVSNFGGGQGSGSVTIYPAGRNGDAKPIATITGADTGLDNPSGIAVDSSGKIYVANRGGGRTSASSITVYAAGSDGDVKPMAEIAGAHTGLDDPCIVVDPSGKLYAGNSSDSITIYPDGSNGDVTPVATIKGPIKGDKTGLSQPNGIALDSKGNIYAANATDSDFNVTVYAAGSRGNVTPIATLGGPALGAQGVAVDSSGKVYVTTQFNQDTANDTSGMTTVLSPIGKGEVHTLANIYTGDKTGLTSAESIAVDTKGNIYLATSSHGSDNGSIDVFAAGRYGNVAPTRTISGDSSLLHFPRAIAVDPAGTVYVVNMGNLRTTGSITAFSVGSMGAAAPVTDITGPDTLITDLRAIALDPSGNIYVVNRRCGDNDIVMFRHGSNGNVAPSATIVHDIPGVFNPAGIAVDSTGKIYVTTSSIRYVDAGSNGSGAMRYVCNGVEGKAHHLTGASSGGAVVVYPAGSSGEVTPISVITGDKTGLSKPQGIAVDSNGDIYVANQDQTSEYGSNVTVYSAGSTGNAAPIATIAGPLTGIRFLQGIALGPATVKIDRVDVSGANAPPTSTRSLEVTRVTSARPTTYRVSWNAPLVPLSSLRLRISCGNGELKVWQSSSGGDKETALDCANPISLPSKNGSLLLRFKSSVWLNPQIALVAQANLLETHTIEVLPSPSIGEVFAGDCEKETGAPLIPGYPFTIGGSGFTAKENTVKLGSETVDVSESEGGELVEVTLPRSVVPGKYELFVENHTGRSDAFPVVVAAPPPPQNVTPRTLASVHPTKEFKPADAPWPMLGRTANHDGSSSNSVAANATLRWKFTAATGIRTPPVIGPDQVTYVGSSDGYLYAVYPDGRLNWSYKTCGELGASAVSADRTVYTVSDDGNLYAINSGDGTLKWKFTADIQIPTSPTIGTDGTVYTACKDDLCAISSEGALKWRFRTHLAAAGLQQGAPAIDKTGVIYIVGANCEKHPNACSGELVSVSHDGTQRWRFATAGTIESSPVIGPDGTIFVEDNRRNETMGFLPSYLYAVSPQGKLRWKFSAGERSTFIPIPAVGADGVVYASSSDCNLYALDPKGVQKWAYTLCSYGYAGGDLVPSAVVDGDGTIYIGSLDLDRRYTLLAIGHDGTSRWSYVIEKSLVSVPALTSAAIGVDGTIYLASNDYSLYAIGQSLIAPAPKLSSVPGKIAISPDKFDLDGSSHKYGSVRVSSSESNKTPIILEKYSIAGDSFSLERTDCEEGQLLYPGKYCDIWFSYWPGMRVETRQVQQGIEGHRKTVASSHAMYPIVTTGKTQAGEIVITTNAQSVEPSDGRVTLVGHQTHPPTFSLPDYLSHRWQKPAAGLPSP